jgi:elongation factor G
MQDIRVTLYDGKHHAVDSKEIAFIQAGKKAFTEAVNKAKPILLEPIVKVQINTPSQFMGDINGDISTMRGIISGTEALAGGRLLIGAQVPLKEFSDYHSGLKSVTEGEGSYTMEFDHYAPLPAQEQKELVKAYNPVEED